MPLYRLLENSAFTPELILAMSKAYEGARQELGLIDKDDPLTQLLASKVIELAQRGVSDPARLQAMVLSETKR
jgi:hypothetical protein